MLFDTKSVLLAALALLTAPTVSMAQAAFPFDVTRDSNGTLTRIELPVRNSIMSEDEDVLGELRSSLKDYQSHTASVSALESKMPVPANADDRKTLEQAKAYLKNGFDVNTLADNRLDQQYAKAKSKILTVKLYRLLAAPSKVDAFDREKDITEVLKQVISEAGSVLGVASPAYSVFEFIVDQYVDALEARREFYQNQLLVLLANSNAPFTDNEKSLIRSSIFYSRLDWYNLPARSKAQKAWATYGDTQLSSKLKPCKGFVSSSETSWGSCFKQVGDLVENRMVSKMKLSKAVSLAFDAKNPHRVEEFRVLMMLARLGVKLLPVPSLAKTPVDIWLSSQYVEQRKSEGYLFGYAVLRNQTDFANWVLTNSANPIIRK